MQVKSRHHLRSDEVREIERRLADRLGVALDADAHELVEIEGSAFDLVLVDGEPLVFYVEGDAGDGGDGDGGGDGAGSGDGTGGADGDGGGDGTTDGADDRGREPFLTVRGANAHPPEGGTVTVDAGAVSFVSDGADVMRPGIVEADDAIEAGELVVVVEEAHGKALAVGRALVDGPDMLGDSGRVVASVHHVGDDLYEFSV